MNGTKCKDIKIGNYVKVLLKQDQRTGRLTDGYVKDILTKFPEHQDGIRVRLETGEIGRVKEIFRELV